jgi:biotin operon repressor
MVRRYVLLWLTCRDASRPSGRSWAKQLGISHRWLQKVVRALKANPEEIRRLQSQGNATLAQLNRAKEYTVRMRERGELRAQGA